MKSLPLFLAVAMALGSVSCTSPSSSRPKSRQDRGVQLLLDGTALRADLFDYADETIALVAGTASNLAANTSDRRLREFSVEWKIRMADAIQIAMIKEDPREALVTMWILAVQERLWITEARGRTLFADAQPEVETLLREREADIASIARRFLPADIYEQGYADIERIARETPLNLRMEMVRSQAMADITVSQPEGVNAILSAPLAPFEGMRGVGGTPAALESIAVAAKSFTQVVEGMPRRIRWQSELFLYEIEDMPVVQNIQRNADVLSEQTVALTQTAVRFADAADSFAATADRLATTTEAMPANVRTEMSGMITDLTDERSEFRSTITDLRAISESIQGTVAQTVQTAETVEATAVAFGDTGERWEATLTALDRVMGNLQEMGVGKERDVDPEAASLDEVLGQVNTLAVELRGLLTDLEAPLPESAGVRQVMGDVGQLSETTIRDASAELGRIVDALTLRGVLLIVLAFVAMMVYRLVAVKVLARG